MTSLALAACESGPFLPAEGEPMIRTDRTEYVAEYVEGSGTYSLYGFTVVARFTNTTEKTVFLGRCYPDTPHPTFDVVLVGAEDAWDALNWKLVIPSRAKKDLKRLDRQDQDRVWSALRSSQREHLRFRREDAVGWDSDRSTPSPIHTPRGDSVVTGNPGIGS